MKNRYVAFVAMLVSLLLAACGSNPGDGSALQDTRWVLVSLAGEPPLAGRVPSAEFAADQIRGSAGCNTYFGTYTVTAGEITVGDLAVTEMWCMEPEGVMDQETAFLTALNSVASYQVDAERLELYDNDGTLLLVFGAETAELPNPADTAADTAGAATGQESTLIATIEAQESLPSGAIMEVTFTMTNTSRWENRQIPSTTSRRLRCPVMPSL